ncbi:hypothetical protein AT269_25090 [Bacillus cereus]|nr:hypothetical protein AT269_25090 [Bacillus cereus]
MPIGTNVLSMNARQPLYENERRMHVALTMVSSKSNSANGFEVTTILNITFKTVEITPLKIKVGYIRAMYPTFLSIYPL